MMFSRPRRPSAARIVAVSLGALALPSSLSSTSAFQSVTSASRTGVDQGPARGATAARGPQRTRLSAAAGFDIGEWLRQMFSLPSPQGTSAVTDKERPPAASRGCTDAVLVLGATGKTGQRIVSALLDEGRDVVVASRSQEAIDGLFDASTPGLYTQIGVDVTDETTLKKEALFDGVSQVVSALGPRFGEKGSSSEAVDFKGVQSAIAATEAFLSSGKSSGITPIERALIIQGDEESSASGPGGRWEPLDDVIMGGRSSSAWKAGVGGGVLERQSGETFGRWAGTLVTEGGGFCGTVIKDMPFDATGFDGIRLRVRGDGSRYKFRLKPDSALDSTPERQYQAVFDTVRGEWTEVDLPFESFVAVKRNNVDYSVPRVNKGPAGGKMRSLGIVLSRFSFNEYENAKYKPGAFQLDLKKISLYRRARPTFLLVSSASAERFHRLNEEERKNDIPIVALNPGGILNWKFKAETCLRQSELNHCIVRPTGLIAEGKEGEGSVRLQAGQGDLISGRVSRAEVGRTVAAALQSPYAAGKTFELRRDEAEDAQGKVPDFPTLFRGLVLDEDRCLSSAKGGGLPLPPFPVVQDPPPPVSEERKQEILNDPRVVAQQKAAREGREAKEQQQQDAAAAST